MTTADDVILVGGEALFDLVFDGPDALRAHPGGGPFNTARTIARLRQPVSFLGRISSDRFGATLERMLGSDGVRLDSVVHTDEPTTLALAEIDASGSAQYHFYERATSASGLTTQDALAMLPPRVSILHVGTLGLTLEPIATALEAVVDRVADSALVAVDPNVRAGVISDEAAYRARLARVLAKSHLVKVSEDDLAWLDPDRTALDAARAMLDQGPAAVLLTRGAEGIVVLTRGADVAVPAPKVDVVDTIGAGDAFGGGFLAWWRSRGLGIDDIADDDNVVDAARFGAVVAALTCARPGASPPFLDELEPAPS